LTAEAPALREQEPSRGRSKSYVSALPALVREQLLSRLDRLLRSHFPDGMVSVPYETWLWQAHKTG
jgi:hypothetical protein